ncbi:hypothetical protein FA95DRAFT_796207 [Auriscalpium vulgare]|uniref:Uncharacterized protein n=1 Tax=Auriscalpium vulgare TaxID=40419 RepID=A0ACB8S1N7_9AGAM|nr:hypothetical protein FA95DRAFT_796207 [Auriscalpium vulgare]
MLPARCVGYLALTRTSPSATVCEPLLLSWSGGTPPYYLSAVPAGQPSAPALKQFPMTNDTSFTWKAVSLAANYNCAMVLKDSMGVMAFSATIAIQGGHDSGCVNDNVVEDPSGTSSVGVTATSAVPATSTTPGTTGVGAAAATGHTTSPSPALQPAAAKTSGSSASTSSTATPSTSSGVKNGAEQRVGWSIATVVGLAGAVVAAVW